MISIAAAVTLATVACVTDVRTRRIPNALTLGGAAAGLSFHLLSRGTEGLWFAGSGWLVGLMVFMPFFLLGGMGGGDVKLMGALGAWIGAGQAVSTAIFATLAGGVLGVVVGLATGYLGSALRNVGRLLKFWCLAGPRPMPGLTLESSTSPRVAFAVPIGLGMAVALWMS